MSSQKIPTVKIIIGTNIPLTPRMHENNCNINVHRRVNTNVFGKYMLYLKKKIYAFIPGKEYVYKSRYPFNFVFVIYILSFYSIVGTVHSCPANINQICDSMECRQPTNCEHPLPDLCSCCNPCIRSENQTCGGWYNQQGSCAEGLLCVISVKEAHFINGTESGICKASISSCLELNTYYGCTITTNECFCMNVTSCNRPAFHYASREDCELVLSSRMAIGPKCMNISCPLDEEICPADSYKLPSVFSPSHCCPVHQGCACLPTTCKPKECPEGKHPKILKYGNKKPGLCCSIYECVDASELACEFSGKRYNHMDVWQADKCTVCSCQSGIIFCQPAKCPELPFCSLVSVPEGECCAVCSGCLSPSGKPYNNSDSWMENDCMACQCVKGQVKCQEQMCQTTCENPQKLPGYCCPVCKGGTIEHHQEKKCLPLTNCNTTCHGNVLAKIDGCPICVCQKQVCPSSNGCTKECLYGYVVDKSGCPKCKCKKCPTMEKCNKTCPWGFNTDYHGCSLCDCKDEPTAEIPTVQPTDAFQPCWMDGKMKYHGDHWQIPPCFNCTCSESHVTCFQEACPPVSCHHPVLVKDHCCPVCLDVKHIDSCEYEGRIYQDGKDWIVSDCTQCTCRKQQVICTEKMCPQIWCSHLIHVPGQCCPLCTGLSDKSHEWSLVTVLISAFVIFLLLLIVGLLVVVIKKQQSTIRNSLSTTNVTTRPKSVNLELQGAARLDNTNKALFGPIELKKLDNVPIITTVNNMV